MSHKNFIEAKKRLKDNNLKQNYDYWIDTWKTENGKSIKISRNNEINLRDLADKTELNKQNINPETNKYIGPYAGPRHYFSDIKIKHRKK